MLFAVRGYGSLFGAGGVGGTNIIHGDGTNAWQDGSGSTQSYLVKVVSDQAIANELEGLLDEAP